MQSKQIKMCFATALTHCTITKKKYINDSTITLQQILKNTKYISIANSYLHWYRSATLPPSLKRRCRTATASVAHSWPSPQDLLRHRCLCLLVCLASLLNLPPLPAVFLSVYMPSAAALGASWHDADDPTAASSPQMVFRLPAPDAPWRPRKRPNSMTNKTRQKSPKKRRGGLLLGSHAKKFLTVYLWAKFIQQKWSEFPLSTFCTNVHTELHSASLFQRSSCKKWANRQGKMYWYMVCKLSPVCRKTNTNSGYFRNKSCLQNAINNI